MKRLWISFGWYSGEDFSLINFIICQIANKNIVLFQIQVLKFVFAFILDLK